MIPTAEKLNFRKEVLQMPLMAGPADMDLARQNYGATMNETY